MADESVFGLDDLVEMIRSRRGRTWSTSRWPRQAVSRPALELARVARAHGLGVIGRLHARVARSGWRRRGPRRQVGCDVAPDLDGAWWLAPGAPYAERVRYADGQVVVGRMVA